MARNANTYYVLTAAHVVENRDRQEKGYEASKSSLNLANVNVFSSSQKQGFIFLKLDLLNEKINCPYCHNSTDEIDRNRPILVRDLAMLIKNLCRTGS